MLIHADSVRALLRLGTAPALWWGIQPVSAGVFGVPAGLLTVWLVSLLSRPRAQKL